MAQNALNPITAIVIGGSAGSLEAVLQIVQLLPAGTQASVIIVLHRKNDTLSVLNDLLRNRTLLPIQEVEDKEPIAPATIYLAPSDYHLLVEADYSFALDTSEKIHYSRPSIDVTFETAAAVFGSGLVGILLSGANADGAEGLAIIQKKGGHTVLQNPETAEFGFMPRQALQHSQPDVTLDADAIGAYIQRLLEKSI